MLSLMVEPLPFIDHSLILFVCVRALPLQGGDPENVELKTGSVRGFSGLCSLARLSSGGSKTPPSK